MKELIIMPNKSIGRIEIGMRRDEIEKLFDSKYEEEEVGHLLSVRYDSSKYVVLYENNRVIEISIDSSIAVKYSVILYGVNLFTTKVEDVIIHLKKYADCIYDTDDELLSTEYTFERLGITLWRESAFHPKLLEEDWFLEMSEENQEYEKKFWYFNMLTMHKIWA